MRTAVAAMDGIIVTLVMSVVGLWIITQLRLWRTNQSRRRRTSGQSDTPAPRGVTPATWP